MKDRILQYLKSSDCLDWKRKMYRQELKQIGKDEFFKRMEYDLGFRVWDKQINFIETRTQILTNRLHAFSQKESYYKYKKPINHREEIEGLHSYLGDK